MKGDIVMSKEKLDELIAATKLENLLARRKMKIRNAARSAKHNYHSCSCYRWCSCKELLVSLMLYTDILHQII